MPTIINSTTLEGVEIVTIEYEDGSFWSGLKSAWEAQQAAQATLASELSNPSTPQAGE